MAINAPFYAVPSSLIYILGMAGGAFVEKYQGLPYGELALYEADKDWMIIGQHVNAVCNYKPEKYDALLDAAGH